MRDTFKIPMATYIKKYVVKKFFNGSAPPYKFEESSLIGKQLMSIIIDRRNAQGYHIPRDDFFEMQLNYEMLIRSPRIRKLALINKYLEKLFKEELIAWILSAKYHGIDPYRASKNFMTFYDIDEKEYSLDAIYKCWLRSKKNRLFVSKKIN